MSESLPNYDKWKLSTPPHYEAPPEKHKLDLSAKLGETVSFRVKSGMYLKQILGIVSNTDNDGVWINFCGHKTYYLYEDMRPEDDNE